MNNNILKTTVFAKKKFRKDGKPYYSYFAPFTKTNGTKFFATIQFYKPAETPDPSACPLNIEFVKGVDGTRRDEQRTDEKTGEVKTYTTIKLSRYDISKEPFVDHSMDDLV